MPATITAGFSSPSDNNFNACLDGFFATPLSQIYTGSDVTGHQQVWFGRVDKHHLILVGKFQTAGTGKDAVIAGGTITEISFVNEQINATFLMSGLNNDVVSMIGAITARSGDQFFDLLGPIKFTGNKEPDVFTGGDPADNIRGNAGADFLNGGAGDDTIAGGKSADLLAGGNGIDTLDYKSSKGAVTISLGPNATVQHGGDAEGDVVSQFENVRGSQFNDTLTADGAINSLDGGIGNDVLNGGDGADQLSGGKGDDVLNGGGGDDVIAGSAGAGILTGGSGIDTLDYKLSAGAVFVSFDPDTSATDGGDAEGDAASESENIIGSKFNDTLIGDGAINWLDGGVGNDELNGGAGADQLTGGSGVDTVSYLVSDGVSVNLGTGAGGGGEAQGDQLSGIENLKGSGFDDTLIGSTSANNLAGSDGNDRLEGGGGTDILDGGKGADVLIGGEGIDTLAGGSNADTFVLFNKTLSADVIKDFIVGADTLEIDAVLFGGGLAAGVDLDASAFEVNATGLASTEAARFILNSVTGQLYFDINGSKNAELGRQLIATLEGTQTGFSESDFAII